jgi:hypothetical protein
MLPLHGAFFIISLAMLVVKLFALIDCVRQPPAAFVAMGKQTKQFWLILLAVAVATSLLGILSVIGLIAALVYLADVRPAVRGGGTSYDRW